MANDYEQVRRAKEILKHLWKQSGLKRDQVLEQLTEMGLDIPKSTLATWYSIKETKMIRPKAEYVLPLIKICSPDKSQEQIETIFAEVNTLLGYDVGPLTTEMMMNKISLSLNKDTFKTLTSHQNSLTLQYEPLIELLENMEDKIYDYDKGYPVVRLEQNQKRLLKEVLGEDKTNWEDYMVDEGYEIPLAQIQSPEKLTEIINTLSEGTRVLRAYIERCLIGTHGDVLLDFPRIEDFVSYSWEIANRLLYNKICRTYPLLNKTLMSVIATCSGIRYLMESQQGQESAINFQNVLQLKGYDSEVDIQCSIAVYIGLLARQLVKMPTNKTKLQKGWALFEKASRMIEVHHENLKSEHDVFYYKKELANLCYDIASLLLFHVAKSKDWAKKSKQTMQRAFSFYSEILQNINLFYQGLTEQRAILIRVFYVISLCWSTKNFNRCVEEINKLIAGQNLNENFWTVQLGKTIAYGVLTYRTKDEEPKAMYFNAGCSNLQKALLVPGLEQQTRQELESDFILKAIFSEHTLSQVLAV